MNAGSEIAAGAALLVALGQLTERQRYVFVMRHLHGFSHEAIAARLGISRSRVGQHDQAARVRLATTLAPYSAELQRMAA